MISLSESVMLAAHEQLSVVFDAATELSGGGRSCFVFFLAGKLRALCDLPVFCVLAGSSGPCASRFGAGGADLPLLRCRHPPLLWDQLGPGLRVGHGDQSLLHDVGGR